MLFYLHNNYLFYSIIIDTRKWSASSNWRFLVSSTKSDLFLMLVSRVSTVTRSWLLRPWRNCLISYFCLTSSRLLKEFFLIFTLENNSREQSLVKISTNLSVSQLHPSQIYPSTNSWIFKYYVSKAFSISHRTPCIWKKIQPLHTN